jgi:hypothetical protein
MKQDIDVSNVIGPMFLSSAEATFGFNAIDYNGNKKGDSR